MQRFQNEAEAVVLLDHAGIVPVYEVGEHEGLTGAVVFLLGFGGTIAWPCGPPRMPARRR